MKLRINEVWNSSRFIRYPPDDEIFTIRTNFATVMNRLGNEYGFSRQFSALPWLACRGGQ